MQQSEVINYQRFCASTKTWTFVFFQKIFYRLPLKISNILKKTYPFSIIFNRFQDAALTKQQFYRYNQFLKDCIKNLEIKKSHAELNQQFQDLFQQLQDLLKSEEIHPSFKFKKIMEFLCNLNQQISILDSSQDNRQVLIDAGFPINLIQSLLPDPTLGISPFTLLTEQFKSEGSYSNFRKLMTDISSAEFAKSMIDPLENPLQFDKDNRNCLRLQQKGKIVRPGLLDSYTGLISIDQTAGSKLHVLTELQSTLDKNSSCKPCALNIKMSAENPLSSELIDALWKLSQTIPYIRIDGLCHLDLSPLSIEAQDRFFALLPKLDLIHGESVKLTLPLGSIDWSNDQLKKLFQLWPARDLNLCNIPIEQLDRFLDLSPCIENLMFNQPGLTDEDLREMNKKGYLQKLKQLSLTGCNQLTTDILPLLMELPELTSLHAPDIQKGHLELPELTNPFDIKLFYGAAQTTRKLAAQLYKGPDVFASIFQIPLARAGEETVFGPNHTILDPQSVNYWLYAHDFAKLSPQSSIHKIYADSSAELNNQNLPEFISKFPEANEISLYNCPHVTTDGIMAMLKLCPQVKKLDLTSCPGITNQLFSEAAQSLLEEIEEIIVSDTKITETCLSELPDQLKKKMRWERKSVTISNDDLKAAGSLKEALKAFMPLNRLVRLNLSGCHALTFQDINELFDQLNLEANDPQRLNISDLILTNTRCQVQWFNRPAQLLGNLNQVVIDNPRIIQPLSAKYPDILFRSTHAPLTETLDMDQQLLSCHQFQKASDLNEKAPEAKSYLKGRTAIELFGEECTDQALLRRVLSRRLKKIDDEDFSDMQLTFLEGPTGNPTRFNLFKNQIYCQSSVIRREQRAGGMFYKSQTTIENQNATQEAGKILTALIKGETLKPDLPWKAVFEAAELANSYNLDIPIHYDRLTNYLYERYKTMAEDVLYEEDEAFDIITRAISLDDSKGIALLEHRLCQLLMSNLELYIHIQPLALNLPNLLFICQLISYFIMLTIQLDEMGSNITSTIPISETTKNSFDQYFDQKNIETIIKDLPDLPLPEQQAILTRLLGKVKEEINAENKLYF